MMRLSAPGSGNRQRPPPQSGSGSIQTPQARPLCNICWGGETCRFLVQEIISGRLFYKNLRPPGLFSYLTVIRTIEKWADSRRLFIREPGRSRQISRTVPDLSSPGSTAGYHQQTGRVLPRPCQCRGLLQPGCGYQTREVT